MADQVLRVRLQVDEAGNVQASILGTKRGFSELGAKAIELNQALELASKGFEAIRFVAEPLIDLLKRSIEEADQQERSITGLTAALRARGQLSTEYVAHLQEEADALAQVSTATSAQILDVQRLLVSFGAVPTNIDPATQAVLDLAAGLNIDLGSAAEKIGRALEGNFEAFSKMGIHISDVGTQSQRLTALFSGLAGAFGGQAAAQAAAFSGQLTQVKKDFDDTIQVFGEAITKSPVLADAFRQIGDALKTMRGEAEGSRSELGQLFDTVLKEGATDAIALAKGIAIAVNGLRDLKAELSVVTAPFAKFAAAAGSESQGGLTLPQAKQFFFPPQGEAPEQTPFTNAVDKIEENKRQLHDTIRALDDLDARVNKLGTTGTTAGNAIAKGLDGATKAAEGLAAKAGEDAKALNNAAAAATRIVVPPVIAGGASGGIAGVGPQHAEATAPIVAAPITVRPNVTFDASELDDLRAHITRSGGAVGPQLPGPLIPEPGVASQFERERNGLPVSAGSPVPVILVGGVPLQAPSPIVQPPFAIPSATPRDTELDRLRQNVTAGGSAPVTPPAAARGNFSVISTAPVESGANNATLASLRALQAQYPQTAAAIDSYEKTLTSAKTSVAVFGSGLKGLTDETTLNKQEFAALSPVVADLVSRGFDPAAQGGQAIIDRFKELKDKTSGTAAVMGDLKKGLALVDTEASAFGDSFDSAGAKSQLLNQAIQSLIAQGVDPASGQIQELVGRLKDLADEQRAAAAAAAENQRALEAQDAAIANVARGGGQIIGSAASSADIQATLDQAAQATAQAIQSGDIAKLQAISSDLQSFLGQFHSLTGGLAIPADVGAAANKIESAIRVALGTLAAQGHVANPFASVGDSLTSTLNGALSDFRTNQTSAIADSATAAASAVRNAAATVAGETFTGPTFKPQISMSPAVPFPAGVATMKDMLAGVADSAKPITYKATIEKQLLAAGWTPADHSTDPGHFAPGTKGFNNPNYVGHARTFAEQGGPGAYPAIEFGTPTRDQLGSYPKSPYGDFPFPIFDHSTLVGWSRAMETAAQHLKATGQTVAGGSASADAVLHAKIDETNRRLDEHAKLIREQTAIARQQLDATKDSGIPGIQSAVSPSLRSATGIRGAL